ncbi:MurR/RpiR family transcriptional regulator [Rhizobium sp. YS-1r]|uniref:MurR/RpiR family transcriptional regulator n=1 Tax=Rhizobium sp. YS-1r TaxID=1532558 RepID=UPI001FCCAA2A|nr:MurR/RpiR family transcriptional regulator [Rhizobium sp. YS-1r]
MTTDDAPSPRAGLPANSVVAERIETIYPELSQALRTFADYVLKYPMKVAGLSINDTVDITGVSAASANRFARKLGFDGYADFRAELLRGMAPAIEPVERLRRKLSEESTTPDVVAASLMEDIANLQGSLGNLDPARAEQAVSMIVDARRIFVLGFDNAAGLALVLMHRLQAIGCDARAVESGAGALSVARHLAGLGPNDLVISIAFPRYLRDTVSMTRFAHQHDIPILVVTDSQTSPIAKLGKVVVYAHARRSFSSTSDAAVLAVLEALAAGVANKKPGAANAAQRFADMGFYWFAYPEEEEKALSAHSSRSAKKKETP